MTGGLDNVYDIASTEAATAFYDRWAADYETELAENGYITPVRAAEALAAHALMPWAPLLEVGCGTGLAGLALRANGFECIDGGDISPEMLARAAEKEIYRSLSPLDLSQPLDEILSKLPEGGAFVMTLNDHARADGSFESRVLELTEYGLADIVFKEHGPHLPEIGLESTVYVLVKR